VTDHAHRMKKGTHVCRHLLPTGKFYYELYQDKSGVYFSDPHTYNCDGLEELKAMVNAKPNISMNGQEHFERMQECQRNMAKRQEYNK